MWGRVEPRWWCTDVRRRLHRIVVVPADLWVRLNTSANAFTAPPLLCVAGISDVSWHPVQPRHERGAQDPRPVHPGLQEGPRKATYRARDGMNLGSTSTSTSTQPSPPTHIHTPPTATTCSSRPPFFLRRLLVYPASVGGSARLVPPSARPPVHPASVGGRLAFTTSAVGSATEDPTAARAVGDPCSGRQGHVYCVREDPYLYFRASRAWL